MKEIIYNYDDVSDNEVNRIVRRAKALIVNDKEEIMFAIMNNNYFLIGGHVDSDESDYDCLKREIKEEIGLDVEIEPIKPFLRIKYLNKDYPSDGINTMSVANYYVLRKNLVPDNSNVTLTSDEVKGKFHTVNISVIDAINTLVNSMDSCSKTSPVLDTIEAVKEYINISN